MARLLAKMDDQVTLTIASLASEAGLSRATLYRAPVLLDRFRTPLEQHNGNNTTALSNTDRIGELEAEITALRGRENDELRDLRSANRNMLSIFRHSACSSVSTNNKSQNFSSSFPNPREWCDWLDSLDADRFVLAPSVFDGCASRGQCE
jgi:hypothetical protein